jgi:dTMP kinase
MFFVAIEGIDASGKATQSRLLKEWFETRRRQTSWEKLRVLSSSFPDYHSHTGEAILAHLQKKWACWINGHDGFPETTIRSPSQYDALAFQCLQTNNRFECLPEEAFTKPENTVLVSDRYHASALVYGSLDGLPMELLDKMNRGLPMPDLYILLDVPVAASIERRPDRRDRYEMNHEYMQKVRERYVQLFNERANEWKYGKGHGWYVVNGHRPILDVHKEIVAIVDEVFRTSPL